MSKPMADSAITGQANGQLSEDADDTLDRESPEGPVVQEQIMDPDNIEERFRVDRRKLEQMIQADGSKEETAEDFFLRIMQETNTEISWPSKLKIGAKSKKDPHIKVFGHKDDVAAARELIMMVLDTKSTRVTLKMDVSYLEHSHVIGKGGNNIKKVMQQTGCHIHFPDSNRTNNSGEKSNQVSIAGQIQGVEQARSKIRELLPIVFMVDIPAVGIPTPDPTSPPLKVIQDTYNVTLNVKQRSRVYTATLVIRGTCNNILGVKEAILQIVKQVTGQVATSLNVSVQVDVAPQHQALLAGRNGSNIKQISQQTGAKIEVPDQSSTAQTRKNIIQISGPIDSVFIARYYLLGCLPMVLMFDIKEDPDIDQGVVSQLMEKLDVFISLKHKPKQGSKSVIIKSIERNATNVYEARRHILAFQGEESVGVIRVSSSWPNLLTVGAPSPVYVLNGPVVHNTVTTPVHFHTTAPLYSTGVVLLHSPVTSVTPSISIPTLQTRLHTPPAAHSPTLTSGSMGQGHTQSVGQGQARSSPTRNTEAQRLVWMVGQDTQHKSINEAPSSPQSVRPYPGRQIVGRGNSPATPAPVSPDLRSEVSAPKVFPHVSSAPSLDLLVNSVYSSSGDKLDLATLSSDTLLQILLPHHAPVTSSYTHPSAADGSPLSHSRSYPHLDTPSARGDVGSFNGDVLKALLQQNSVRPSLSNDGLVKPSLTPDRCSPGLFQLNSFFDADDYEQKKLKATKAIANKPHGESRVPTDCWAGYGFSKSMPDYAIRKQLPSASVKYGPTMATNYEAAEDEVEDKSSPWSGSPLTSPANSFNNGLLQNIPGLGLMKPLKPPPGLPALPIPPPPYCSTGVSDMNTYGSVSEELELAELFTQLGLEKYTYLFQEQEIDFQTFLTLTDHDLKELGISTFGARRKMITAIQDLNEKNKPMVSSPSSNPFRRIPAANTTAIIGRRHDIASQSGRW